MSCYHPLKRFILPNGDGFVCGRDVNFVIRDGSKWRGVCNEHGTAGRDYITQFQYIPCGSCIGCRLDYSRNWADRMCMEASFHESNYFLTLTYDDDHLPSPNYIVDVDTGEVVESPFRSLSLKAMQDFMKRLRKNSHQKVRYYLAGEYGDLTFRPHYHLILFGLKLDDMMPFKRSKQGFVYYTSDFIRKCWPYGNHFVTNFSWETAAYTARYVMKKLKGRDAVFYKNFAIEPPFTLMSTRPGIGRDYYNDNKDYIYRFDGFYLSNHPGIKIKPPRYFDKLYDLEYPENMEEVKRKRKIVSDSKLQQRMTMTDLSYYDYLAVEETAKINKLKVLQRKEL